MRATISTAYSDSRAAQLSLAYGLPTLPALGTHLVRLAACELELRVLGASHQVVLTGEGGDLSETVACLSGQSARLPEHQRGVQGGFHVEFSARVHRLDADEFAARVDGLARRCAADEHALIGEFPGSPLAITALLAERDAAGGACWRTWHAYPQAGELVETRSVVSEAIA